MTLQTQKEWESIDYHNDLSITGWEAGDARVTVEAKQQNLVWVFDAVTGARCDPEAHRRASAAW